MDNPWTLFDNGSQSRCISVVAQKIVTDTLLRWKGLSLAGFWRQLIHHQIPSWDHAPAPLIASNYIGHCVAVMQ